MRVAPSLLPLLAALLGCAAATEVICYWGSWSHYRTGAGQVTVDDLDPHKCTVYIYAFATLHPSTYKIQIHDTWLDIDLKGYEKFVALKQTNPSLRVLIALGGWNDSRHPKYSELLASPSRRSTFNQDVVQFLQRHGFDGLDLDYEYPTAADKPHFAAWVTELKEKFQPLGLMLSAAVTASASKIAAGYDVPTISGALDMINVMTYDMHGSWEVNADHHAPFRARPSDGGLNVQSAMAEWMRRGAPARKLVMGIPLYGRTWTVPGSNKTPPAPGAGAGLVGQFTQEAGLLSYLEICMRENLGWTAVQDPSGKIGPYAYSGDQWVGYDDAVMVAAKTQWALSQGFGAIMVWDVSSEDVRNACHGGTWPLMTAINNNLSPGTTSTPATTYSTTATSTTTSTTSGTTNATTSGTTTPATTSATASTTTTTTSPGGGGPFTCPELGTFPDPADCSKYYSCGHSGPVHYTCGAGLLFDPALLYCNWANQVSCTATGTASTSTGTVSTTTSTASTTSTTVTPSGPFTCPSPYGNYIDPADCHSFYKCFNHVAHHETCHAGTSWSTTLHYCDWDYNTGCT